MAVGLVTTLFISINIDIRSLTSETKRRSLEEQDNHAYYNLKEGSETAPIQSKYSQGGPVIIMLSTGIANDLENLERALQSLRFLHGDDPDHPAPVLVFNKGDLNPDQINRIVASTKRPIAFPQVDLQSFPPEYNPEESFPEENIRNYQMIRFWVTSIWEHPALSPYDVVMKIDTDSCFMEDNNILPDFPSKRSVYQSEYVGMKKPNTNVKEIYSWTEKWLETNSRLSNNPMFWSYVKATQELYDSLPMMNTAVEVFRKSFMQSNDVKLWSRALTEEQGCLDVLRNNWSYGALRFMMTAIFVPSEKLIVYRPAGSASKELCDPLAYAEKYPWFYSNKLLAI